MLKVKETGRAPLSSSSHKMPKIVSIRSLRSNDNTSLSLSINSRPQQTFQRTQVQQRLKRTNGNGTPIDLSVAPCTSSKTNIRRPPPMIPILSSASKQLKNKQGPRLPRIWHICEYCDASFESKDEVTEHHRNAHHISRLQRPEIEIIPINLPDDGQNSSFKRSLADNIIYHPPANTRNRRISTSSNSSSNQDQFLHRHNNNYDGFSRPFELLSETCRVCSENFSDKRSLMSHMKAAHPMESRFGCSICDRVLSSRAALIGHMRTHTGEKPHTCDVCNRAFSNSQTLTRHRRTHTGEKPYECPVCGKRASLRHNMKLHIKIHEKQNIMFLDQDDEDLS